MRCRKVRSYLSAYCRGELSERRRSAVAAHLAKCTECRQDEAVVLEIDRSVKGLPVYKTLDGFNSRLLNRMAQERFQETRNKAYMPKRAPIFGWGRLVPAFATVCLTLALVFFGGFDILQQQEESVIYTDNGESAGELDDRYLTAQPRKGHALTQHARADWAFKKQLARANRIRNLMNRLASQDYFGSGYFSSNGGQVIPAAQSLIRQRTTGRIPIINTTPGQEVGATEEVR